MVLDDLIKMSDTTYGRAFDQTVARYPTREAFIFQDKRVTWEQAAHQVNRLAKSLLKLGVKKGDSVGVWMTNNLEWLYSWVAIVKIGATVGAINTRFKTAELSYALLQSDISTLILSDVFLGGKINVLEMIEELVPELSRCEKGKLRTEKFPMLKNVICVGTERLKGMYSFDEVLELGNDYAADNKLAQAAASVSPDDILDHSYTSGTTGLPKAVQNCHRGWLRLTFSEGLEDSLGVMAGDKILNPFPLAGGMGLAGIHFNVVHGVTTYIMEKWDAVEALELIQREKLTGAYIMGPSMIRMMLALPDLSQYDISSFKRCQISGEPASPDLVRDMFDKLGMDVVLNIYGMVETHGDFSAGRRGHTREQLATTVGTRRPWAVIKIIDPDTGEEAPMGQEGEVWAGASRPGIELSRGYYKSPENTAKLIDKDGWVHTGDIGRIRKDDGHLMITGRVKDMIIVGGYNVYPAEIEGVLTQHPAVKMAAVLGIPDQRLGEVPIAFVQLKQAETVSEAEIIDFCNEQLSNTKVPRQVRFIAEMPLTMQQKVQKVKLRQAIMRELGLSST